MKGLIQMIKKNWQIVVLVLVISVVAGFGFKGGCSPKQQQQFRDTVKIGAAASVEVNAQIKDYCRAELISAESCAKSQPIAQKVADIAQRIDVFVDQHPKLTIDSKREGLALADDLLKELDALEADGVVVFKDPNHRKKFLLYLAIGKSSVRIARVAIDSQPTQQ
jgi:hypothetical protein